MRCPGLTKSLGSSQLQESFLVTESDTVLYFSLFFIHNYDNFFSKQLAALDYSSCGKGLICA